MTRPGTLSLGWTIALGAVGTLVVLAVLPPVIGGTVGAGLHAAFSAVCHQLPERSPHFHGDPIALCHRCFGILAGLLVGLAVLPSLGRRVAQVVTQGVQPVWLVTAALPTALDWALGAVGLLANTPASRLLTGAVFGIVAGAILGANLVAPPRARSVTQSTSL